MTRVWVAWADPASGRVIGAYSTREWAEAAAFRFSRTPEHYEGYTLEVLEFELNSDGEVTDAVAAVDA